MKISLSRSITPLPLPTVAESKGSKKITSAAKAVFKGLEQLDSVPSKSFSYKSLKTSSMYHVASGFVKQKVGMKRNMKELASATASAQARLSAGPSIRLSRRVHTVAHGAIKMPGKTKASLHQRVSKTPAGPVINFKSRAEQ